MAGGTWTTASKVLPGAYLNFRSVPRSSTLLGNRGIATVAMPLSWGAIGELIEVISTEYQTNATVPKIGFNAGDADRGRVLTRMLEYCHTVKIYRSNRGGARANATMGNLGCVAKYEGLDGNKITVAIVEDGGLFIVETYFAGRRVDAQTVLEAEELENNDFVSFSGTGELVADAGTVLTGGTDGSVTESTLYPEFFEVLSLSEWQTLAVPSTDTTIRANAETFIKNMRDGEGKYVQGVIAGSMTSTVDTEAIVEVIQGGVIAEKDFSTVDMTCIVAAMTAGSSETESNTARPVRLMTSVVPELTNSQRIEAIKAGKFIFGAGQDGRIRVVQDINTLHTFTPTRNRAFSKNKVLRVLDQFGIAVKNLWENTYMGSVGNDANNREIFRSDVASIGKEMQRLGAVQNFAGVNDLKIRQGDDLDSVIMDAWIQPVDVMEKLYTTVNVIG